MSRSIKILFAIIILSLSFRGLSAETWEHIPPDSLFGTPTSKIIFDEESNFAYVISGYTVGNRSYTAVDRFDGNSWEIITTEEYDFPFEVDQWLFDICLSNDGTLWAGMEKYILRFQNEKWEIFEVPEFSESTTRNNWGMWTDSEKNLFFRSTIKAGLMGLGDEVWKFDGAEFVKIFYNDPENEVLKYYHNVQGGAMSSNDELWIFSTPWIINDGKERIGGLYRYKEGVIEHLGFPIATNIRDHINNTKLQFDKNGKLWLLYGSIQDADTYENKGVRLAYLENDEWTFLNYEDDGLKFSRYPSHFFVDSKNNIWYGSASGGVSLYDHDKTVSFNEIDINNVQHYIHATFDAVEAPDGSIWFASGNGIYIYKDDVNSIEDVKFSDDILIFPNPVHSNGVLNFRLQDYDHSRTEIRIYDLLGYEVYKGKLEKSIIHLDKFELNHGIYQILLETDNKIHSTKLIVK